MYIWLLCCCFFSSIVLFDDDDVFTTTFAKLVNVLHQQLISFLHHQYSVAYAISIFHFSLRIKSCTTLYVWSEHDMSSLNYMNYWRMENPLAD